MPVAGLMVAGRRRRDEVVAVPIHRAVARATGDVRRWPTNDAHAGHEVRSLRTQGVSVRRPRRTRTFVRGQAREERTRQRVSGKDDGARARLQRYAGHELLEADGCGARTIEQALRRCGFLRAELINSTSGTCSSAAQPRSYGRSKRSIARNLLACVALQEAYPPYSSGLGSDAQKTADGIKKGNSRFGRPGIEPGSSE